MCDRCGTVGGHRDEESPRSHKSRLWERMIPVGHTESFWSHWREPTRKPLLPGHLLPHSLSLNWISQDVIQTLSLFWFLFLWGFFCFFVLVFLPFLGPLQRHMEVPRLGVESELQPPAYARATATRDPSRFCNLHHSSWQCQSLNPLSKARDQTQNLMVPSQIC